MPPDPLRISNPPAPPTAPSSQSTDSQTPPAPSSAPPLSRTTILPSTTHLLYTFHHAATGGYPLRVPPRSPAFLRYTAPSPFLCRLRYDCIFSRPRKLAIPKCRYHVEYFKYRCSDSWHKIEMHGHNHGPMGPTLRKRRWNRGNWVESRFRAVVESVINTMPQVIQVVHPHSQNIPMVPQQRQSTQPAHSSQPLSQPQQPPAQSSDPAHLEDKKPFSRFPRKRPRHPSPSSPEKRPRREALPSSVANATVTASAATPSPSSMPIVDLTGDTPPSTPPPSGPPRNKVYFLPSRPLPAQPATHQPATHQPSQPLRLAPLPPIPPSEQPYHPPTPPLLSCPNPPDLPEPDAAASRNVPIQVTTVDSTADVIELFKKTLRKGYQLSHHDTEISGLDGTYYGTVRYDCANTRLRYPQEACDYRVQYRKLTSTSQWEVKEVWTHNPTAPSDTTPAGGGRPSWARFIGGKPKIQNVIDSFIEKATEWHQEVEMAIERIRNPSDSVPNPPKKCSPAPALRNRQLAPRLGSIYAPVRETSVSTSQQLISLFHDSIGRGFHLCGGFTTIHGTDKKYYAEMYYACTNSKLPNRQLRCRYGVHYRKLARDLRWEIHEMWGHNHSPIGGIDVANAYTDKMALRPKAVGRLVTEFTTHVQAWDDVAKQGMALDILQKKGQAGSQGPSAPPQGQAENTAPKPTHHQASPLPIRNITHQQHRQVENQSNVNPSLQPSPGPNMNSRTEGQTGPAGATNMKVTINGVRPATIENEQASVTEGSTVLQAGPPNTTGTTNGGHRAGVENEQPSEVRGSTTIQPIPPNANDTTNGLQLAAVETRQVSETKGNRSVQPQQLPARQTIDIIDLNLPVLSPIAGDGQGHEGELPGRDVLARVLDSDRDKEPSGAIGAVVCVNDENLERSDPSPGAQNDNAVESEGAEPLSSSGSRGKALSRTALNVQIVSATTNHVIEKFMQDAEKGFYVNRPDYCTLKNQKRYLARVRYECVRYRGCEQKCKYRIMFRKPSKKQGWEIRQVGFHSHGPLDRYQTSNQLEKLAANLKKFLEKWNQAFEDSSNTECAL